MDRAATDAEVDQLIGTAVAAFRNDPLYRWLQPNPVARERLLQENFRLTLGAGSRKVELWSMDHGASFALWSTPGESLLDPDEASAFAEMLTRHAGPRAADAGASMSACATLEPHEPHATVHLVAVHPLVQRRGLGARILGPLLDHCDAARTPVWLESSNPTNVRFYERLGFLPSGTVQVPGGPVVTTMLRSACSR